MATNTINHQNLTGIIPAAGFANRLLKLPCSKEIYPVNFQPQDNSGKHAPKVISSYLIERLSCAGAEYAHIIIRKGKWDIPEYFGFGDQFGLPLSYIIIDPTKGASFTIDKAYPFITDRHILFGFPDIYFEPEDAFLQLLNHQKETGADVVLGLFKAHSPHKMDMVELEEDGSIRNFIIKPENTDLELTWIIAVWNTQFSEFLHQTLSNYPDNEQDFRTFEEIHLGHVFQQAIDNDFAINSVIFHEGRYLDIGTPDDLKRAPSFINRLHS